MTFNPLNKLSMKKVILLSFVIIVSCSLFSCKLFSDECWLDGCERKGQGWQNYEDNPSCINYTACRVYDSGYYCSKSHAIEGLRN